MERLQALKCVKCGADWVEAGPVGGPSEWGRHSKTLGSSSMKDGVIEMLTTLECPISLTN